MLENINNELNLKNYDLEQEINESISRNVRLTRDITKIKEVVNEEYDEKQYQKKKIINIMVNLSNLMIEYIDL